MEDKDATSLLIKSLSCVTPIRSKPKIIRPSVKPGGTPPHFWSLEMPPLPSDGTCFLQQTHQDARFFFSAGFRPLRLDLIVTVIPLIEKDLGRSAVGITLNDLSGFV